MIVLNRSNVKMYEVMYDGKQYRLVLSVPAHTYELFLAELCHEYSDSDPYVEGYKLITTGCAGCGDSDDDVIHLVSIEADYYHDCQKRVATKG